MERLDKLVSVPAWALHVLGCGVTLLMMVHIVVDVIAKYAFNSPIDGTLEIVAAYYMVVVVFASLAHVTRNEGHILVELFTRSLPPRAIAMLDALMGILTFIFLCVLTWKTYDGAVEATELGEIWETGGSIIEVWPSHWVLPVGFIVMTAYVFIRMVQDFQVSFGKVDAG